MSQQHLNTFVPGSAYPQEEVKSKIYDELYFAIVDRKGSPLNSPTDLHAESLDEIQNKLKSEQCEEDLQKPSTQDKQNLRKRDLKHCRKKYKGHKSWRIYCVPGKSSFYDDIPIQPNFVNETADYLLSKLFKF